MPMVLCFAPLKAQTQRAQEQKAQVGYSWDQFVSQAFAEVGEVGEVVATVGEVTVEVAMVVVVET